MPSIKQSELNDINHRAEYHQTQAAAARDLVTSLSGQVKAFDGILDKIVRAANGAPLIDNRNTAASYSGWNDRMLNDQQAKLSKGERQAIEVAALNRRVVDLECRLAAVNAVAVFAKEHKA